MTSRSLLIVLLLAGAAAVSAQERVPVQAPADSAEVPAGALERLRELNVRDADLRDVLRAIARQHRLNLAVDERIEATVTLRLADLPVIEVLEFLAAEYGLVLECNGVIFRVRPRTTDAPAFRLTISAAQGLLFADVAGAPVEDVARALTDAAGVAMLVHQGAKGMVTGYLQGVPLESGLQSLFESNGFKVRATAGIYTVVESRPETRPVEGGEARVSIREGLVDLDLRDAGIGDVLREVADRLGVGLILYTAPEGRITARAAGLSVEQTLGYLLKSTDLTYRREGDVFVVGGRQLTGIASTRLLRLQHIHPNGVAERLPESLRRAATFEVIDEQNALLVTAPQDLIAEIAAVIAQIDTPTPQILIEALVVDFERSELSQFGVTLERNGTDAPAGETYAFGGGSDQAGGITLIAGPQAAGRYVDALTGLLGVGSIGRLPSDFYLRVQALERQGKVQIRSRPRIATLNGHKASISVGTTQYYILKTLIPYAAAGQVNEAEHFERVEANVTLEITPWVGASGEVTAEIHPTFATPVGVLDPRVPPTINNRTVQTTVRLREGETIAIGGLIQDGESEASNRVPVLGRIPLLGRLFRNRRRDAHRSELVIFITPHVFFGDVYEIEPTP
ncbi:MAG: hypothetical protein R2834_16860 [Rhodothermales bacterium]